MKELGELLKTRRESKGISLEEVSVATKISIKVLVALEEGDLEKLPPKPFVRGFVQSYARYLGLDVKETLDMYSAAMGISQPTQLPIVEPNKIERSLPGSARNILTVFLIILTIIIIVVVQRVISKREAEMRPGEVQAITGNAEPLKIQAPSPSSSPIVSGSPSQEPSILIAAATSTPANESTATPNPTATPTPMPTSTPKPKATPKAPVESTPTATPVSEAEAKPSATAQPSPEETPQAAPVANPQEVIVEALDKVTLKITIDDGTEKEITMNADQIQTFKGKYKIKIYSPDGGAISIINNGFDLGVPGNLGQPKTMVFPK